MRQGLLAGMTLLLASCGTAQVAMAPPGQDAAGKQFNPPPPGLAAVYFYNPMTAGRSSMSCRAPWSSAGWRR